LVAGDESPAYRSRNAYFLASRRVGVRGIPGLRSETWATRQKNAKDGAPGGAPSAELARCRIGGSQEVEAETMVNSRNMEIG
jgi:hypothetical protein